MMNLAHFDPRTRLMLVICISTLAVIWQDSSWLAGLACFTGIVLVFGHIDRTIAERQLKGILKLIALLFVVQCVFARGGDPLAAIGGHTIVTSGGVAVALSVTLRLLIVVFSALILLAGNARDYLLAMVQCRVPYELAFMVTTAGHFLPILRDEALDVYNAVQMRGTELAKASLREKVRVYVRIALPVVAGAIKRAECTSIAMEARAFRASHERTFLRHLALARRDVVCLIALPLGATAALVASLVA